LSKLEKRVMSPISAMSAAAEAAPVHDDLRGRDEAALEARRLRKPVRCSGV
jgi:hypothetical protein